MTLTKYGKREWLRTTVIALIFAILFLIGWFYHLFSLKGLIGFLIFDLIVWLAAVAFFRDPNRKVTEGATVLTAPADGVVRDIEFIPNGNCGNPELAKLFEGQDMLRIGIFLSVFDVHVNRAPCDMQVVFSAHKNGAYHDARNPDAIKENESLLLGGKGKIAGKEFPMAVKQISGAIARRIVCEADPGTELKKGERYGMIKFGSRTELYLPAKIFRKRQER